MPPFGSFFELFIIIDRQHKLLDLIIITEIGRESLTFLNSLQFGLVLFEPLVDFVFLLTKHLFLLFMLDVNILKKWLCKFYNIYAVFLLIWAQHMSILML